MVFPWVRHYQRYEYVLQMGYIDNKVVLDVGAGDLMGSLLMTVRAGAVCAIDPVLMKHFENDMTPKMSLYPSRNDTRMERLVVMPKSIYEFREHVDVCVVVEVLEHMSDPRKFIKYLAKLGENMFITTPLAERTGKTRNREHVVEYSNKAFRTLLEERFNILDLKYQTADLRILDNAKPNGDSIALDHVVQMAWCERKK